jgi:hypothetical protein
MSAAVSFFTSVEAFLDPRGLWIRFNKTLWTLYRIKDDLEYKSTARKIVAPEELDALYQRLQDVLMEAMLRGLIEGSERLTLGKTQRLLLDAKFPKIKIFGSKKQR